MLDLPGVAAEAIRVLFKAGVVLVVGEKERPDLAKRGPASFHLVERDFGRFARAVRINAAIDASQARARLANGELRVVLPRITERRGAGLIIPIETDVHVTRMKLLFLGDIVGRPGRDLIRAARARARRAPRRRPRDRQRRERGRRRGHHAREHARDPVGAAST